MLQTQNFTFVANINFRGAADSLFFESHQSGGGGGPGASVFSLARPEEMFAISLNRTDRLRLISANSDVQHNVGALGTLKIMISIVFSFIVAKKSDYNSKFFNIRNIILNIIILCSQCSSVGPGVSSR